MWTLIWNLAINSRPDALGSQLEDLACLVLIFFPRFDGPCSECGSSLRPLSVVSFVSKLSKSCRSATLGLTIGIQDEAFVSENDLVTIGVLLEVFPTHVNYQNSSGKE